MNINPFINLIGAVLHIYQWIILIWIVLSWLIYFKIVNPYQPFIYKLNEVLTRLIEPLLKPIRRFIPHIGGVDISPIILVLLIYFVQDLLYTYLYVR